MHISMCVHCSILKRALSTHSVLGIVVSNLHMKESEHVDLKRPSKLTGFKSPFYNDPEQQWKNTAILSYQVPGPRH